MRIIIAAVGRFKAGPERDLFEQFSRRVTWPLELREVEEKRPLDPAALIRREGELLLAQVPDGAVVVALDETGKPISSQGLADAVTGWQADGTKHVVFAIGGAEGLDAGVRERADRVLSLGPMTWPHMLVRGMLAEQLYRAQSILAGHPYHRA